MTQDTSATEWATGYRVAGGPGPTSVDLEELAQVCRVLERAADRLDRASWALLRAAQACDALSPAGLGARRALAAAREGRGAPWRVAEHLRRLAAALRRVVELYTQAESVAHRALRCGVVAVAGTLGEMPLVAAAVGAAGTGLAAVVGGWALAGSVSRSVLLRRPDPIGRAVVGALAAGARDLPGRLTADGRAELEILAVGAFVRAARPGLQIPTLRPVPGGARTLFGPLPPAGPTALLVRVDPPQLPTPRTTADVLDNVALSYDREPTLRTLGMPEGVLSVQRLTHPDGTRAWVVEIPGTETWDLNATNSMDLTTNGRLLGGLPDDVTAAVITAMRVSGIAPDEPVMLAGHSQGGMVAMSVAAAVSSAYSVRAVVTVGAPDIPQPAPAGVQVRHYRHTEDLVPQLDGTPDRPAAGATIVTRDLGATGGPAVPSVDEAHAVARYVETAVRADRELAGSPGMRSFDAAAGDVLGPSGTTAVTRQFEVTRDPAVVAAQPPRVLPSR
ncbi:thioesterase domain-containing protein [Cellulomonas fengjieae]|uniref:thioesterase domain-containing protein n=1 Tax=Cellulomonas fengjieae TaxID=2819978 RepID=UPI001AAFA61D|nr:thioesterase domain-containing protein [Cellulomonas fengjieae]MBO3102464.1 hypothetical protein [Cellulomonas fengjieae]